VDVVYDGAAALQSTVSTGCDVVVLDRDLPRQLPRSAGVDALIDALGRGDPLSQ
jgi:DNA-binding response OmpR family regulator